MMHCLTPFTGRTSCLLVPQTAQKSFGVYNKYFDIEQHLSLAKMTKNLYPYGRQQRTFSLTGVGFLLTVADEMKSWRLSIESITNEQ